MRRFTIALALGLTLLPLPQAHAGKVATVKQAVSGTDLCEARRGDLIGREGLGGRGLMLPRVVA